jgi:hypothetical protein
MVLDWLRELPPGAVAQPPVCVAVADARERAMEWDKLKNATTGSREWGSFEFARFAYKARALDEMDERAASQAAWKHALTAAQGRPERLESIARQAIRWHWKERGAEALWKLAATGYAPGWALDALQAEASPQNDAAQLLVLSKLRMNADPRDIEARKRFLFLSLLTNGNEGGIHERADALHKELPGNAEATSIYAFSLYRRGKINEALDAMLTLKPEQLRQPGAARYHGLFLAAAGRRAEAAKYFALGEKETIFPEERMLIEQAMAPAAAKPAKASVVDEPAKYLRLLDDAAASTKPEELPKLVTWMATHGLAGLASGWSAGLAPETASRPEVRLAIAGAHTKALEWRQLKAMAESGSWAELDYLRSAHLARALRGLKDDTAAETAWNKALADAAAKDSVALERLALTAQGFGWEHKTGEALWQLALKPGCPRWAAELLWETSLARGTASQLAKASRLLEAADPLHARTRDRAIVAAMLARTNDRAMWDFAGELNAAAPGDVVLAAIHALALQQQGRAAEAKALIGTLAPKAMKEPRSALYYSVFLIVSQRPDEAAKCMRLPGIRSLPLEETALVSKAKIAAQDGSGKPGGK